MDVNNFILKKQIYKQNKNNLCMWLNTKKINQNNNTVD